MATPNDIAQLNLAEPEQTDWDTAFQGSSYTPPPPALGPDGKAIVYYGTCANPAIETERPDKNADNQPVLTIRLDPIKLVNAGKFDGQELRFTRVSVKPFMKNGEVQKGNPHKLGQYLRACGAQSKPQTNQEYLAAVKMTANKKFPFTLDWEGYNRDTGESIKGFLSFPEDPERPGQRKSILKKGDFYNEISNGQIVGQKQVQSDVIFANARLRYFRDPSKGTQG
jgi:hypothetical protein